MKNYEICVWAFELEREKEDRHLIDAKEERERSYRDVSERE